LWTSVTREAKAKGQGKNETVLLLLLFIIKQENDYSDVRQL